MKHLWKRVGTGSWIVLVAMAASVAAFAGVGVGNAAQQSSGDLLMAFADFQPLHSRKSVLVVDVRDAVSFMNGRIPGALHVPADEIPARLPAVRKSSRGRVVVTYCSCPTESSSLRAAKLLSEAGITAKALAGGFPRWVESGGPIERDAA